MWIANVMAKHSSPLANPMEGGILVFWLMYIVVDVCVLLAIDILCYTLIIKDIYFSYCSVQTGAMQ